MQPPVDGGASAPDCQQPRESCRYPKDHNDVAQDAKPLWRARSRCDRDENETKGDSDHSEDVERAGGGEVLGDPDEAGRDEDADSPDNADTEAEHEC